MHGLMATSWNNIKYVIFKSVAYALQYSFFPRS